VKLRASPWGKKTVCVCRRRECWEEHVYLDLWEGTRRIRDKTAYLGHSQFVLFTKNYNSDQIKEDGTITAHGKTSDCWEWLRVTYHSEQRPPFIPEVKNEWNCTSIPPICHHSVERDNFTFHHRQKCTWGVNNFYCCTVHFDNLKILFTNKCTLLLKT